jgi:anaerobic magnesium-protoporphyrin IX monomethyl ester cyclase
MQIQTEMPYMDKVLFLKPPVDRAQRNVVRDFVYGCWCNGRRVGGMEMPPLNELYAATHARQEGVTPVFLDAQLEPDRFEKLKQDRYNGFFALVIMSATQSFRRDVALLEEIKSARPDIKTILFGSHPTFMPQYSLQADAVDYVILREPEQTIRELLAILSRNNDPSDLPGLGYRDADGKIRINPDRPFMDLDELPIPDRSLLPKGVDYFNPVVKKVPYTTMQTSRGCPGHCIFCTAPAFYGRRVRTRSADSVLEELGRIKQLGFREVFFRDETFTAYEKRNHEICKGMIRENLDLAWIANARVDMVDAASLKLMKQAGCHMIKFGVESGNDEILRNYKKGTNQAQIRKAFAAAQSAGLDTHAHLVFGGPGETLETIDQTIGFVKELKPTTASFGILTPYPGSKLFDMVVQQHPEIQDGTDSNMDNLHVQGFFNESLCNIGTTHLSRAVVRAYRKFYLRPSYLARRMFAIRSIEEFMVLFVAGLNVFQYALTGDK